MKLRHTEKVSFADPLHNKSLQMATSAASLSAILVLLSLLLTSSSAAHHKVVVPTELVTSSNEFSCDIYRQVGAVAGPGANVFLSPFSVLLSLGMVHAGAKGRTRSQMTKAMHLDGYHDREEAIGDAFRRLISIVNSPSHNYTLRTANRLFVSDAGLQVREIFLSLTEEYFSAGLMAMNFAGEWDESRIAINRWVSDNTESKIKNLLPEGSIDADTLLVIVSAIYFRGYWSNSFEKAATREQTFHLSQHEHTTVDMMTRAVTEFNYHESADLDCQVLELPYVGKVSMFVLLPRDVDGLSSVESRLNAGSLAEAFRSMEATRVKVSLPKFEEDQMVTLRQSLEQMGMTDMFENKADLSGIDGTRRLKVTEAAHKAFIAVDEEGTEAAASTAYVLKTKSAAGIEPSFVTFTADRPFVYAIVNRATNCVLFLGRFVTPSRPRPDAAGNGEEFGRTAERRLGGERNGAGSNGGAAAAAGVFLGIWLLLLLTAFVRKQG